MKIQRVVSEDPIRTQWQLISRYTYQSNVQRYRDEKGLPKLAIDVCDYITGCFRQADAYYISASNAPLDISPLLLYYGTTNLLAGSWALIRGSIPVIKNHGMRLKENAVTAGISDNVVIPHDPMAGALQKFCEVFADGCAIANGAQWSLLEILGSIPDIRRDFLLCYPGKHAYTLPIENVRTVELAFDRFPVSELSNLSSGIDTVLQIPNYSQGYLPPQNTGEYVILYPKPRGHEIGFRSLIGEKYLELPHLKSGQLIRPGQLVAALMGLYATATLSRYSPKIWHPFVRSDATGERHVIEQLISVCKRYLPNLILNQIEGVEIQFSFTSHNPADMPVPMKQEEVERIAREVAVKILRQKGGEV